MEIQNNIYKTNDNLATEDLGEDGIIILNLIDEYTHILNDIGKYLWSQVDGQTTVGQIIDKFISNLEDKSGFSNEDIRKICVEFFCEMEKKDLIIKQGGI